MRSLTVIAAVGLVLSPAAARVVWAQGWNIPARPSPSEQYAANLGISYRPVFYPNGTFGARLTRPPVHGSPAARLQLEPGDTIFALDGLPFRTPADVLNHRAQTRVDFINVRTNAPQSSIVYIPLKPPPLVAPAPAAPLGVNAITQAGPRPEGFPAPEAPPAALGYNAITQAGSRPQKLATGMDGQPRLPLPTPGGFTGLTGDALFGNIPAPPPPSELYAANLGIYYRPVFYPNGEFGARLTRPPVDGSPAAQLQLEPGDTIFALDGIPFRTPADVLSRNPGAQTRVDFVTARTNASQSSMINIP